MIKAVFHSGADQITVNGLHQWDYGQQLQIEAEGLPAMVEVHFACAGMKEAVVRPCSVVTGTGVGTVTIPDVCLEQSSPITAWVFEISGTSGVTTKTITLNVIARARPTPGDDAPADFSNRYTELITAVNQQVESLKEGNVTVENAINAGHATTAGSAYSAEHATYAARTDYAPTAGSAKSADYATAAGSADYATAAGSAKSADTATSDIYGQPIHERYAGINYGFMVQNNKSIVDPGSIFVYRQFPEDESNGLSDIYDIGTTLSAGAWGLTARIACKWDASISVSSLPPADRDAYVLGFICTIEDRYNVYLIQVSGL